jgi:hypothetical protein
MNISRARKLSSDELLLAGHMLRALERGHVQMHASDYRTIASWVGLALGDLDTPALKLLHPCAPPALLCVIENLLHARHEPGWSTHSGPVTDETWSVLHARLTRPALRSP